MNIVTEYGSTIEKFQFPIPTQPVKTTSGRPGNLFGLNKYIETCNSADTQATTSATVDDERPPAIL